MVYEYARFYFQYFGTIKLEAIGGYKDQFENFITNVSIGGFYHFQNREGDNIIQYNPTDQTYNHLQVQGDGVPYTEVKFEINKKQRDLICKELSDYIRLC